MIHTAIMIVLYWTFAIRIISKQTSLLMKHISNLSGIRSGLVWAVLKEIAYGVNQMILRKNLKTLLIIGRLLLICSDSNSKEHRTILHLINKLTFHQDNYLLKIANSIVITLLLFYNWWLRHRMVMRILRMGNQSIV
jgi:hypothetical protein